MSWQNWVLDAASFPGVPCFCPIEEDGSIVVGMNLISDTLDKGRKLVGVFHSDGQDACDAWWEKHQEDFKVLQKQINETMCAIPEEKS